MVGFSWIVFFWVFICVTGRNGLGLLVFEGSVGVYIRRVLFVWLVVSVGWGLGVVSKSTCVVWVFSVWWLGFEWEFLESDCFRVLVGVFYNLGLVVLEYFLFYGLYFIG